MIWVLLAGLAGVAVFSVASLFNLRDAIHLTDKLRRNDARLAAERWEVLQERHDATIELITSVMALHDGPKPEVKGAPKQKRKKAT